MGLQAAKIGGTGKVKAYPGTIKTSTGGTVRGRSPIAPVATGRKAKARGGASGPRRG